MTRWIILTMMRRGFMMSKIKDAFFTDQELPESLTPDPDYEDRILYDEVTKILKGKSEKVITSEHEKAIHSAHRKLAG